jgi:hypothetical protein
VDIEFSELLVKPILDLVFANVRKELRSLYFRAALRTIKKDLVTTRPLKLPLKSVKPRKLLKI